MAERKLSDEEVKALLEGLGEGLIDLEAGAPAKKEYKKYTLGADDITLLGDLYTLRIINERFGRQIRNVLLPMLRFAPRVGTLPPKITRFDEYSSGLDSFVSLATLRVDALKGTVLLVTPPRLISILVNSFYGGRGESQITRATEFTPMEERLIQIIIEGAAATLTDAWKDVYPTHFEFLNSEINPSFLSFLDGTEQIVLCSFAIQLPFAKQCVIEIAYPLQMLKQIAPLLRSKVQTVGDSSDSSWTERLREALLDVTLEIAPRIAEPSIDMASLLQLKAGLTVPIEAFADVPVFVGGQSIYKAKMGEKDGKMAISIV